MLATPTKNGLISEIVFTLSDIIEVDNKVKALVYYFYSWLWNIMSVVIEETYEHDQVAILHQTKNKFRQLASSLLLTSTFINNKLKISKNRL